MKVKGKKKNLKTTQDHFSPTPPLRLFSRYTPRTHHNKFPFAHPLHVVVRLQRITLDHSVLYQLTVLYQNFFFACFMLSRFVLVFINSSE